MFLVSQDHESHPTQRKTVVKLIAKKPEHFQNEAPKFIENLERNHPQHNPDGDRPHQSVPEFLASTSSQRIALRRTSCVLHSVAMTLPVQHVRLPLHTNATWSPS